MKPVDQTQFVGEGAGGDCVRASLASILEMPLEALPHFLEVGPSPELWEIEMLEWLETHGITVWRERGHYQFDGFYLASGPAKRGTSHMVVYRNGQLVHDPHPSRAGLIDVHWSRMLVPLDPSKLFLDFVGAETGIPVSKLAADAEAASRIQSLTASNEALTGAVDAFADICDELGCERDNEAGLAAAHDLNAKLQAAQAEIARMREALEERK